TDFPSGHARTQRFNTTDHFMPGNTRQSQTRVDSRHRGRIGVTDSARLHSEANLACSRVRDSAFHYSKLAWRGDLHGRGRAGHWFDEALRRRTAHVLFLQSIEIAYGLDSRCRDLATYFEGTPDHRGWRDEMGAWRRRERPERTGEPGGRRRSSSARGRAHG